MTEQEWLRCTDALQMLDFLRGKATDRKLRLFAVACCRRCPHVLADKPYRHAPDVAEQFAERLATANELGQAYQVALGEYAPVDAQWLAAWFADPYIGAWDCSDCADAPAVLAAGVTTDDAEAAAALCVPWAAAFGVERAVQAAMLRDIMHAPYRPIHFRASWRRSNSRATIQLAKAIYEETAFDRLPILADALEDAGCTDADILNHCRQPGEHVRGCWVVDLVLGQS